MKAKEFVLIPENAGLSIIECMEKFSKSQNKELIEEHNELLETHEATKQQNIDVHDEWKELNNKNKYLIECRKIWGEALIKDQKRSAKTINDLYEKNKELIDALGMLTRSMLAHPDCVKGSEFDDFTTMANDLILKNRKK